MTTQVLEASKAQSPPTTWNWLSDTYVCRASVRPVSPGTYEATAIRMPQLVAAGDTADKAIDSLVRFYEDAMRRPHTLRPVKDLAPNEILGAVTRLVSLPHVPSVRDIDAVYDNTDLADDEVASLEVIRAAGTAQPTIPLVRVPRQ